MLIKFVAPDPRAGMVVDMDAGQQMIDEHRAVAHKEGAAEPEAKMAEPMSNKMAPALTNKAAVKPAGGRGR